MALKDLEGKGPFQKILGVFVEFLSGWKLWCEKGALANIGKFLVDFGSAWSG
jgi:hypothetical protein